MTAMASHTRSGRQRGFTYASVVILVTIIGLAGAMALRLGTTMQRAAAEKALLDIGVEYSNALASYAAATPSGQPNYPHSFAELLKDPRFPQLRRHLRRIYVDPMTGKKEWGIVKANENGGILAIYSLSKAAPIKIGNFPPRFAAFEGKTSLSEWKFTGEGVEMAGAKGANAPIGQQPGAGQKPGTAPGMQPGTINGMTPGTVPGAQTGSKPGTPQSPQSPQSPQMPQAPQEPPKPAEPQPEPEPPQEPQEPPQEQQQDTPADPAREEPPPPRR